MRLYETAADMGGTADNEGLMLVTTEFQVWFLQG